MIVNIPLRMSTVRRADLSIVSLPLPTANNVSFKVTKMTTAFAPMTVTLEITGTRSTD